MNSTIFMILAFVGFASASAAQAEEAPDPAQVSIQSVVGGGSGCPAGAFSTTLSPDRKIFSVLFDRYEASAGAGNVLADKKACDIDVEVAVPQGWQFALSFADYRGFAAVDAMATAFHQVVYSFGPLQGGSPRGGIVTRPISGVPVNRIQASFNVREFRGPINQEYAIRNELSSGTMAWSSCDASATKKLRISTSLLARVLARTGNGARATIALDSVDGALDQAFGLKWQRCQAVAPPSSPVTPPSVQTLTVYKATRNGDVLTTIDAREPARAGYVGMVAIFKTFYRQTSANQVPLFRCLNLASRVHFVSRDAGCEGAKPEASIGFVASVQEAGLVAIGRYRNVSNAGEILTVPTSSGVDLGRYRFEGVLGFALPPN